MIDATQEARRRRSSDLGRRDGSTVSTAIGFVASLAAATAGSCCALPLALASAGLGGAWLGNLAALVPYRPYLLGVAAVGLAIAWISAIRRLGRRTCGPDGGCGRRPPRRWTFGVLALSTLLVMFAAASNWLEPLMVEAILGWARTS